VLIVDMQQEPGIVLCPVKFSRGRHVIAIREKFGHRPYYLLTYSLHGAKSFLSS